MSIGGILIRSTSAAEAAAAKRQFLELAADLGIDRFLETPTLTDEYAIAFRLLPELRREWMPDFDTQQLCARLGLTPQTHSADLDKEILLAMLAGPVVFEFPSHDELAASIRVRRRIAQAARRTALDFHTSKIERPTDYWTYSEDTGFTVLPGKPLIEALRKATQPAVSGERY